ncbi:triose-phosphate isomerase [Patescibacteria group bacterium]|nr:triose-phosphate isomerase [Patescibacteria group bacterium]MCL5010023.1 triose-phosphate isomerase [Patescibacteria group bacterium]
MKPLFIVANWKANKTEPEAKEWLRKVSGIRQETRDKRKIIVCPPFILLPILKSLIINYKSLIKLGAQDISPFEEGAYTGEVSGRQIKEFADYVIIGHSERRRYFGEEENMILKKIEQSIRHDLIPIICISNLEQVKNLKLKIKNYIIAYEPLFAIGSGVADTPENAEKMAGEIKSKLGGVPVLYGGSVSAGNIHGFTSQEHIDGVLVGGGSLDPLEFAAIVKSS